MKKYEVLETTTLVVEKGSIVLLSDHQAELIESRIKIVEEKPKKKKETENAK